MPGPPSRPPAGPPVAGAGRARKNAKRASRPGTTAGGAPFRPPRGRRADRPRGGWAPTAAQGT
eukprot:3363623-Lingulodinium_polyedra.AAC.1